MRRRIRLKKRLFKNRKISKFNFIVFLIILLLISLFFLLKFINKKVTPILFLYAKKEATNFSVVVISNAIANSLDNNLNKDNLFIVNKDDKGNIISIDYDSIIMNRILIQAVTSVQKNLKNIENGNIEDVDVNNEKTELFNRYDKDKLKNGIIYEIPMGIIFNNSFLSNIGPKIPIRLKLFGDITSNLNTKITQYGINNAMIETRIHIKITLMIILPLTMDSVEVNLDVPIILKLLQGPIPNYYLNGYNQNSPILTLPVE